MKSPKKSAGKKSIFRSAGETIGTIGHEITEGKDKLVEAAHSAMEIFSVKKKAATKKAKKILKKVGPKIASVKKAVAREEKKITKKVAKKITKKAIKKAVKK